MTSAPFITSGNWGESYGARAVCPHSGALVIRLSGFRDLDHARAWIAQVEAGKGDEIDGEEETTKREHEPGDL